MISSDQSKQLRVDAVTLDQSMEVIPPATTALVALDVEHVELADQVTEDDGAIAWPVAAGGIA